MHQFHIRLQISNSELFDGEIEINEDHPANHLGHEENDEFDQPKKDIFQIMSRSLKEAKKLKLMHTVKIMTQLTAVTEYVKLHAHYVSGSKQLLQAMHQHESCYCSMDGKRQILYPAE